MEISENVETAEEAIAPKKVTEETQSPKKQQAVESENEGKISKAHQLNAKIKLHAND